MRCCLAKSKKLIQASTRVCKGFRPFWKKKLHKWFENILFIQDFLALNLSSFPKNDETESFVWSNVMMLILINKINSNQAQVHWLFWNASVLLPKSVVAFAGNWSKKLDWFELRLRIFIAGGCIVFFEASDGVEARNFRQFFDSAGKYSIDIVPAKLVLWAAVGDSNKVLSHSPLSLIN